jgi:hypothetical protein
LASFGQKRPNGVAIQFDRQTRALDFFFQYIFFFFFFFNEWRFITIRVSLRSRVVRAFANCAAFAHLFPPLLASDRRFMMWTDLWAAVRDAGTAPQGSSGGGEEASGAVTLRYGVRPSVGCSSGSRGGGSGSSSGGGAAWAARQARTEAACMAAIAQFAAQGGRDPWGLSFDSRCEFPTL